MTNFWPNWFRTNFKFAMLRKAVGASATIVDGVGIVDMSKNRHAVWAVMRYSGTAITQIEVLLSESSDMSSPVVLKTKTGVALDANDDRAIVELRTDEIAQKAAEDAGSTQYSTRKAYRYAAVRLTATNGDVAIVSVIADPLEAYDDLTAEVVNN
jgi:hypothetical protein